MANVTTGLFETLVAAASMASQGTQYQNAFLDCIAMDVKAQSARFGQTLQVTIDVPDEGDVVDIGGGEIQTTDTNHNEVDVVFNKHVSTSWVIKDWDEVRTPENLAQKYFKPRLESVLRKVNRIVAQLVTTANFNSYSLISGSGADIFARADLTGAWTNLAGAGIPVDDSSNMFFITNAVAYGGMLGDTNFIQQYIVGDAAAVQAQQQAKLRTLYGANVRFDQHIANYNSGKQAGIFMHRAAIAMVTAPLPMANAGGVVETITYPRSDIPVLIQMQYSVPKVGWVVHMHTGFGVKVVRADYASLLETA